MSLAQLPDPVGVKFEPFNKINHNSANSASIIDFSKANDSLNLSYEPMRFKGVQKPLQFAQAKRVLRMKQHAPSANQSLVMKDFLGY